MEKEKYLEMLYIVDSQIGRINDWFRRASESIENNTATETLSSEWARMTFDKMVLRKYKENIFSPFVFAEHEYERLKELIPDVIDT